MSVLSQAATVILDSEDNNKIIQLINLGARFRPTPTVSVIIILCLYLLQYLSELAGDVKQASLLLPPAATVK